MCWFKGFLTFSHRTWKVWVTWFLNKWNHCLKKPNLYFLEIFKNKQTKKTTFLFQLDHLQPAEVWWSHLWLSAAPWGQSLHCNWHILQTAGYGKRQKWILLIFRALKNEVDWCVIKADLSQTSLHCTVTKAVTECGLCNMFNGPILWCFLPTELLSAGQVTVHQTEPYSSITISSAKLTMAAWTHLQHPAKT